MNRLPFGIGDFLIELKEATFKGDYEGHPFRGNQFEGGGSGNVGESGSTSKMNILKDGEPLPRYDRINGKKVLGGGVIKLGNGQRVAYYIAQAYNNRVYSFDKAGEIWRTSKRQAYIDAGGDKSMLSPSEKEQSEELLYG